MEIFKFAYRLIRQTVRDFLDDDCIRLAASLAYYTIFSLPPLLLLVITVAGVVLNPQEVARSMQGEIGQFLGPEIEKQIERMIEGANQRVSGALSLGVIFSIGGLLVAVTAAFGELQYALNRVWNTADNESEEGLVKSYLMKRLLSLGMIIIIGGLITAAFLVSSLISVFYENLELVLQAFHVDAMSGILLWSTEMVVSILVLSQLFALMFKVLPDTDGGVLWRHVEVGALLTALLFVAGKFGISTYLGYSNLGDSYGAAAALSMLLIWIYFSYVVLLFGAEFTHVLSEKSSPSRS
jgi:membrane protein